MWNVLNETVHKHVYAVNKQVTVLMKRRDWCSNNRKELRSEKTHATTAIPTKVFGRTLQIPSTRSTDDGGQLSH